MRHDCLLQHKHPLAYASGCKEANAEHSQRDEEQVKI